jgi:hypothetical protein
VNSLVLSGTATHVLSGTRSSCYRGPESVETYWCSTTCGARNFSNPESFGFFLTDRPLSTLEDNRQSFSVTPAALHTGNTGGKTTPQLKGDEVRQSFSAEAEPS